MLIANWDCINSIFESFMRRSCAKYYLDRLLIHGFSIAGMLGLGRAMRVTPGSAPVTEATAAAAPAVASATAMGDVGASGGEDANRKRKADGDATHSPKPPMPAGDYKRRSPQHEVGQGQAGQQLEGS